MYPCSLTRPTAPCRIIFNLCLFSRARLFRRARVARIRRSLLYSSQLWPSPPVSLLKPVSLRPPVLLRPVRGQRASPRTSRREGRGPRTEGTVDRLPGLAGCARGLHPMCGAAADRSPAPLRPCPRRRSGEGSVCPGDEHLGGPQRRAKIRRSQPQPFRSAWLMPLHVSSGTPAIAVTGGPIAGRGAVHRPRPGSLPGQIAAAPLGPALVQQAEPALCPPPGRGGRSSELRQSPSTIPECVLFRARKGSWANCQQTA